MNSEKIKTLNVKQHHLEALKNSLKEKQDEFDRVNNDLLLGISNTVEDIYCIKEELKKEAESEYNLTGLKKLFGGIGIRIINKLQYHENSAIKWAEENMPVAIKKVLDKKTFESFAKTADLEFVDKIENVTVTFPKEIKI